MCSQHEDLSCTERYTEPLLLHTYLFQRVRCDDCIANEWKILRECVKLVVMAEPIVLSSHSSLPLYHVVLQWNGAPRQSDLEKQPVGAGSMNGFYYRQLY